MMLVLDEERSVGVHAELELAVEHDVAGERERPSPAGVEAMGRNRGACHEGLENFDPG
jgi:hypothetical protein